ncbi:hypothetical protein KSS87_008951 [Heliosperma pusillum]|nr:hypothetical protein KSS87_008951 [Heliosperma pusillum]
MNPGRTHSVSVKRRLTRLGDADFGKEIKRKFKKNLVQSEQYRTIMNQDLAENNELPKKRYAYNEYVSSGMVVEGFAVSEEMASLNLIWVIGRMQVEVNSYPSWGDIVQVETWCSAIGKHGLTCSSRLTNLKTGKKIMRVDSEFVMINKNTRRLSKILEEIKARGEPYVRENYDPITVNDKFGKLRKLDVNEADNSVKGIRPMWFDLDPNQHVNNVKYISWILEGTPETVRGNCELAALTVEYRRECGRENVLQSLSTALTENPLEFDHLLCMENGKEVARARTLWRSSTSE